MDHNIRYKRTDDLLLTIGFDEGTSNSLVEDDNEDVAEEEDAIEEERIIDVVNGSELDPYKIWQSSTDGSKVTLFFKIRAGYN